MDRSQQFLRGRGASSTSLSAHVLAFKIIYKQVPELMEPIVSGISYILCICQITALFPYTSFLLSIHPTCDPLWGLQHLGSFSMN